MIAAMHLRMSFGKWAAVPLVALGLCVMFVRDTFWLGIWPEAGAAVVTSIYFMTLLAVGFSAWAAARSELNGTRSQAASSVRPARLVECIHFAANLLWLLSATVAVVLVGAVASRTSGSAPGFSSFLLYVTLAMTLMVLCAAFGWFVGRLFAPVMASLVAILLWFIFLSTVGSMADMAPVSGPPWVAVDGVASLMRLSVVAILAFAVCLIPEKAPNSIRHIDGAILSTVVFAVTCGVLLSTNPLTVRPPPADLSCVGGKIEMCLWPEHAKYIPMVQAVELEVEELPPLLNPPDRMVEYSLSGSTLREGDLVVELDGTFDPEFLITEGSRWSLARSIAIATVAATFAECPPGPSGDPEYKQDQLQAWIEARLAGSTNRDYRTDAPPELEEAWTKGYAVASDLTDAEQETWVQQNVESHKQQYCSDA